MTKLQTQVKNLMKIAGQQCPDKPTMPDELNRRLRLNLIGEEFVELCKAFGFKCEFNITDLTPIPAWLNLVDAVDATADLRVTIVGTDVAMGIDGEPIDYEVNKSNLSKFSGPFQTGNFKWKKGPEFVPPNIEAIITYQSLHGVEPAISEYPTMWV